MNLQILSACPFLTLPLNVPYFREMGAFSPSMSLHFSFSVDKSSHKSVSFSVQRNDVFSITKENGPQIKFSQTQKRRLISMLYGEI